MSHAYALKVYKSVKIQTGMMPYNNYVYYILSIDLHSVGSKNNRVQEHIPIQAKKVD